VRALRGGDITWDDFMEEFGEVSDPPIAKVVDLVEHEPQRGGMLGLRESEYRAYVEQVQQAIEDLESASRAV
jgi:hypothetical protein